jgi:hypothetical protein
VDSDAPGHRGIGFTRGRNVTGNGIRCEVTMEGLGRRPNVTLDYGMGQNPGWRLGEGFLGEIGL